MSLLYTKKPEKHVGDIFNHTTKAFYHYLFFVETYILLLLRFFELYFHSCISPHLCKRITGSLNYVRLSIHLYVCPSPPLCKYSDIYIL